MFHRRAGRNRAQGDGTPATADRRVVGTKTAGKSSCPASARARWTANARSSGSGDSTSTSAAGDRMREAQPVRVQELPVQAEVALHAVGRIPGDRKVDRGEVDADLVRPTGLEPDVEEGMLGKGLDDLEPGHRLAAARPCRASAWSGRGDRDRWRRRCARCASAAALARARGTGARPRDDVSRPEARTNASSERATTSSPEVSRSSRWTIPGRSGSSPPAAPRPRSCAASVPVDVPAPAWTVMPAGLSTTTRCSSSYASPDGDGLGLEPESRSGERRPRRPSPPRAGGSSAEPRRRPSRRRPSRAVPRANVSRSPASRRARGRGVSPPRSQRR